MTKQEHINIHLKVLDNILNNEKLNIYFNRKNIPLEIFTGDFSVQISQLNEFDSQVTFQKNLNKKKITYSIIVPLEDIIPYVIKSYEVFNEINAKYWSDSYMWIFSQSYNSTKQYFETYFNAAINYFSQPISSFSKENIKSGKTPGVTSEEHIIMVDNSPHKADFKLKINILDYETPFNLFNAFEVDCVFPYRDDLAGFDYKIYIPMLNIQKFPYLEDFQNKNLIKNLSPEELFKQHLDSNYKNLFLNAALSLTLPTPKVKTPYSKI